MPFEEGCLWCSDCQGSRKFTSRREARFLIHLLCKGADNEFYGKSRISNNQELFNKRSVAYYSINILISQLNLKRIAFRFQLLLPHKRMYLRCHGTPSP